MYDAPGDEFHYVLRGLSPYSEHTVIIQACNTVGCVNSTATVGRTQQAGGISKTETLLFFFTMKPAV